MSSEETGVGNDKPDKASGGGCGRRQHFCYLKVQIGCATGERKAYNSDLLEKWL
jgi:hypothetical protein